MPIFISYSHADKVFVDKLALQLVVHKVHVWLDRWEIHAGDSLLSKVQEAITGASGLLVILSKASVKSEWCTKELNAGLMRELDEKRVVVVPVLIEDCEIPLFLREKFYADFRENFDLGLQTILESLARVTNEWQGRIEEPELNTDWSIDWGTADSGDAMFRLTMLELPRSQPYSILGMVTIVADEEATRWHEDQVRRGRDEIARMEMVTALANEVRDRPDMTILLENQFEVARFTTFDVEDVTFGAAMTVRRLGMDTGRDILFRLGGQIAGVAKSMQEVTRKGEASKAVTIESATRKTPAAKKKTVNKTAKRKPGDEGVH